MLNSLIMHQVTQCENHTQHWELVEDVSAKDKVLST